MQLLAVLTFLVSAMSVSAYRSDMNVDTWTQQRLIKFPVEHVSFIGDPVLVIRYNAQLFQQTSNSPGILWLWCLRRLDVTVGCADVRNGVTLWIVCSRTCQVTIVHPFPRSAELRSLHTCRAPDVAPCCVRDAISIMFTTSTL